MVPVVTAPTMSPDLEELVQEDLALPCDIGFDTPNGQCENPAQWSGKMRCCGNLLLICEMHRQWLVEWLGRGVIIGCVKCEVHHSTDPFLSLEPL